MLHDINAMAASLIGQRLSSVHASLYCKNGIIDFKDPQQLQLTFERGVSSILETGTDGLSIRWLKGELAEIDMEEDGKFVVGNISHDPVWRRYVQKSLKKVEIFITGKFQSAFGICLYFNETEVYFFNLGDDLFIYDKCPSLSLKNLEYRTEIVSA